MDEFEKELKIGFLEESTQMLDEAEQVFLDLESSSSNPEIIDSLFRMAHNLKGTARAVGFGDVAEFTHQMENLILKIKEKEVAITPEVISVLLECNDFVREMVNGLTADLEAKFDISKTVARINSVMEADTLGPSNAKAEFSSVNEVSSEEEITVDDEYLSVKDIPSADDFPTTEEDIIPETVTKEEVVNLDTNVVNQPVLNQATNQEPQKNSSNTNSARIDESVRVNLSRLDKLNNFVGELVILQSVLNENSLNIESQIIIKTLRQLTKISNEIQELSMSLRMIPIKQTVQKMQRIVRDTSKALNKKVQLNILGEETQVDKTILEHITNPLVHIIRNAVDHGLETPEERLVAGKSETGTVTINAYHEGNSLIIKVTDDGHGIDPAKIRKKAIERKLISSSSDLSDKEIIQFIFAPGFSTKEEVSEISGRGVGMDVVNQSLRLLSGGIEVDSVVGKGSVFKIHLPLTLAIIEGMVIQLGEEKYVIPKTQVFETLKPKKENVSYITGVGEVLDLRGTPIPLRRLSRLLQRPIKESPAHEQIAIVIQVDSNQVAILVDDILRQQQVVIKQLGKEVLSQSSFVGSSILGDGMPAIIVDLYKFVTDSSVSNKQNNFIKQDIAI